MRPLDVEEMSTCCRDVTSLIRFLTSERRNRSARPCSRSVRLAAYVAGGNGSLEGRNCPISIRSHRKGIQSIKTAQRLGIIHNRWRRLGSSACHLYPGTVDCKCLKWVAVISAKNHKRQRRKRQSVTAKREMSQTPKVLTAILTLPNLT